MSGKCPLCGSEIKEAGEEQIEERHNEEKELADLKRILDKEFGKSEVYSGDVSSPSKRKKILEEFISGGKKVFVHCKNGHARSPTLVAAYLIKHQGMSVEDALKLINEKRPESHIEKSQRKVLEEFGMIGN